MGETIVFPGDTFDPEAAKEARSRTDRADDELILRFFDCREDPAALAALVRANPRLVELLGLIQGTNGSAPKK